MPRILSILLAIVLLAVAPLFLTACGNANVNAVAKAAAKDYFKNHVDYENFANTTYTYEENSDVKTTFELEYKESAEATEKTKGTFTNSEAHNTVYNFYVVNVSEKIALVLDINSTLTEKTFSIDENDILVEDNDVSSKHTVYKLSFIEEGDDVTYYLTKEVQRYEGNDLVETTKNHREYDEEDYIYNVEQILSHINGNLIKNGYFEVTSGEVAMFYGSMLSTEGSGSTIKVKMAYDTFYVDDAEVIDVAMEFAVGFKNNKLGKINMKSKITNNENYTSDSTAELSVSFSVPESVSAEVSLTGSTALASLSVLEDDLPRVEFAFM